MATKKPNRTDGIGAEGNDANASDDASTSFVITGFGPFGGVDDNPTTVIVRELDSFLRSPNNDDLGSGLANLVKEYVILETSAEDVCKNIERIQREYIDRFSSIDTATGISNASVPNATTSVRKLVLLHLGVARSSCFRLESCAYNDASFRIPDQKGYQPFETPIVPDHELGRVYETSLDLKDVRRRLKDEFPYVSTIVSTDPGRYVCNYVYCKSLQLSTELANADQNNATRNNRNDNVVCTSLFLHVPNFDVVPREKQIAYVAGLIRALAAQ